MATENYIELHILEHITNGFSERSKIGRGGYGDVYKGVYDGREVAVKLLHVDTLRGLDDQQFKNEVCNLLKGGSLDKCLYGKSFAPNWSTRYNIIKGICEGLNFLHDRENPILHLDLKPANILLDSSMVPKVANFGLSRLFNGSHTHVTERIAGTKRYMPPESTIEGMISVKNDVFSFGVVMIDIMIGSLGHSNSGEMDNFTQLTKLAFKNCSNLIEDKSLYREAELDQVNKCIGIATHCVHPERKSRPTMADILVTLNKTEIDIPKRRMKLKGHASYDQETYLPFSPGLNVIAGDESSGKTSLLTAVQCALDTQCLRGANYHESDAGTAEEVSVEIGLDKDILGLLGHPTDQQQALTMSVSRDADHDVKQYKLGASSELDINSDTIFRVQTLMTGSNAVIRFLQQGTLMVDRNAISQINSSIQNVQGYLDKCTNSFNREEQVLKLLKNTMVAERELKDLIRKLLDKAKEKVKKEGHIKVDETIACLEKASREMKDRLQHVEKRKTYLDDYLKILSKAFSDALEKLIFSEAKKIVLSKRNPEELESLKELAETVVLIETYKAALSQLTEEVDKARKALRNEHFIVQPTIWNAVQVLYL